MTVQTRLAKSLEAPNISDSSASKSMAVTPALLPVRTPLASTVAVEEAQNSQFVTPLHNKFSNFTNK